MDMKKILVVDDSDTIRRAIRRIVEPMGFGVQEAADGAQALHVCEGNPPLAAILLDIDMPEMDGIQFLRALRGNAVLRQPPVVMCTTHCSLERIVEAMDAGADEYVMKPFDAEIIASKLAGIGIA
jgi:two-component system, chemotaxis family, chemotaxis protein CheY